LEIAARGFGPTVEDVQAHEVVAMDVPSCHIPAGTARIFVYSFLQESQSMRSKTFIIDRSSIEFALIENLLN
jgi:hypothetical protein